MPAREKRFFRVRAFSAGPFCADIEENESKEKRSGWERKKGERAPLVWSGFFS